ncbi:sensor histidine kinase [Paenibacillus chitinolyticus]|uniref:histidine kinase n=1 Tax=Paenibacillus chitinolyticus TaxID=79263 RepID=A0A410WXC8_9BACL|nr:HAMP domain-containing sensor histidine kinase [Paenibacillus chitinolyticus]MCY9589688.1 HAMP domain-containing histidine kinase [Paenibacillus chitinolyticus]MCY9598311.1 HAMP domain-containing histidine kinase [Paenibacillus chitinolyticus]QAV19068.1 sensor histidine kinase [Paenibacillus chitinolyticus]
MSIRMRLTLLYSGILSATLLLFGIVLYSFLQIYFINDLKDSLREQTDVLQESVTYKLKVDPLGSDLDIQLDHVDTVQSGMYLQLVNLINGDKARTRNLGQVELPFSKDAAGKNKKGYYITEEVQQSPFLIYNQPLLLNGKLVGILQSAYNIGLIDKFLSILRLVLILLSLVVVCTASFMGWLSSKRALKPVYALIEATRQIQKSDDLGNRIAVKPTGDEVSLLGTTINGMLERIQHMYGELDKSYMTQRRFVADASHELRTPLTTISGNAEFLQKAWLSFRQSPEQRINKDQLELSIEAIHDIADEAGRMGRLVHNLLTLARADSGLHLRKDRLNISSVVQDVIRKSQVLVKSAEFQAGPLDGLESLHVVGDRDYLQQLLFIFVENAFKYTENGCVRFFARAAGDNVELIIEDTGIGMDETDIPHIFDRFYRADPSRGETPGTGLGLSIAKWILEEHRGTVEIRSRRNEGTRFTIRLPVVSALREKGRMPALSEAASAGIDG